MEKKVTLKSTKKERSNKNAHCVKSVQIRSFLVFSGVFILNAGKHGPEKTPYLDTFQAVVVY